jgi:type III pantothenate kinase
MELLVDLGNRRLKWCWLRDGALSPIERLQHGPEACSPELGLRWAAARRPQRVLLSSVAGPVIEAGVVELVHTLWGLVPVRLVASASAMGVHNAYPEPTRLGSDRWAALLGAWARGLAPCVIVDAGTAVTVDVLDVSGQHLGGAIFSGLGLSRSALGGGTHQLPLVDGDTDVLLGRSTDESIRLGTREALIGAVDRLVARVKGTGTHFRLVLSGGDAGVLFNALQAHAPVLCDDLVFAGLAALSAAIPDDLSEC